jgi:hypothetical protein
MKSHEMQPFTASYSHDNLQTCCSRLFIWLPTGFASGPLAACRAAGYDGYGLQPSGNNSMRVAYLI